MDALVAQGIAKKLPGGEWPPGFREPNISWDYIAHPQRPFVGAAFYPLHAMNYEIEQHRQQAEYGIGSFKSNLDQYAQKPTANQQYYTDRLQSLCDIRAYILLLEDMLIESETERQNAYRAGYQAGYSKAEKQQRYNGSGSLRELRHYDPNAARAVSIRDAQTTWPELF